MGLSSSSNKEVNARAHKAYNARDYARDITIHCERGGVYLIIFDFDLLLRSNVTKLSSEDSLAHFDTFEQLVKQWAGLERYIGITSQRVSTEYILAAMEKLFGPGQDYFTSENVRCGGPCIALLDDIKKSLATTCAQIHPHISDSSSVMYFVDISGEEGKRDAPLLVKSGVAVCQVEERLTKDFWIRWVDNPAMWPNHERKNGGEDPIEHKYEKNTKDYSEEAKAFRFPGRANFEAVRRDWVENKGKNSDRKVTVPTFPNDDASEEMLLHCTRVGADLPDPVPLEHMVAVLNDAWNDD